MLEPMRPLIPLHQLINRLLPPNRECDDYQVSSRQPLEGFEGWVLRVESEGNAAVAAVPCRARVGDLVGFEEGAEEGGGPTEAEDEELDRGCVGKGGGR